MSDRETQLKLSMHADNELRDEDELEQVDRLLANDAGCRRELEQQGALNMLLKSHFSPEPSQDYLDSFWPQLSERLDEAGSEASSANGGGSPDDVVVFKTSPAMQLLKIPERRRPVVTSSAPTAPAPAEDAPSPWRWPVALIMSTAIVAGAYLAHQRMNPPPAMTHVAHAPTELSGEPAGSVEPGAADAAMQVAMASPGGDGGMTPPAADPAGDTETADPTSETVATSDTPRRKGASAGRKSRRRARRAGKGPAPKEAAGGPAVAAAAAAPRKVVKKASSGKANALDDLIDGALGGKGKAAPAPKKAAAAPGSDLPEQLNMNQIRNAMNKIKGRVQSCYDQFQVEGMAKVRFKISPTGKAGDLSIRGKFRGTDTGDCVIKGVKRARFPKFSGKPMTIKSYPFLLQ